MFPKHPSCAAVFAVLACAMLLTGLTASPAQAQLLGDLDSDARPTVLDLTRLIGHLNGANLLPASLLPYGDINEDGVINANDVTLLESAILGLSALPNPYAAPIVNAPVTATNGTNILITGVARPNRTIHIQGGAGIFTAVSDGNGNFSVLVTLQTNRANNLFLIASNGFFAAGTPSPLRIIQDSQLPSLFIDFPTNNQTLFTSTTVIAGRVGDMLSGFMGLNVSVSAMALNVIPLTTNTGPANVNVGIGNNGTYERGGIPLALGTNLIRVTASDLHGNTVTREIQIIRSELTGPRLVAVSGDMQMTNIMRHLAQPLVVRALDADGVTPLPHQLVTFEVTRSDGRLLPMVSNVVNAASPSDTGDGALVVQTLTDENGEAGALWTLGADAGCANNRISVTSTGTMGSVYFCASAKPEIPLQINVGTGNDQRGETAGPASESLRAWVNDRCNGVPGVPITFTVVEGGGKLRFRSGGTLEPLEGASTLTVLSSATGHGEVFYDFGAEPGLNRVEATFPDNFGPSATFILMGVQRETNMPTMFRGFVFDNTERALGNAYCELVSGEDYFDTVSDSFGRFVFTNVPPGPAVLLVDGSSVTNVFGFPVPMGSYPALHFNTVLIPNAVNELPTPVFLPRMNPQNVVTNYGTNDVQLTCSGVEGLKFTIKASSMRHPDGTLVTPDFPALVSVNPVQYTDFPMPLPDGASPLLTLSLQPPGAHFDPPVQLELPNVNTLPPGAAVNFLNFDHGTERFEIVGSGHVVADGSTVVSDPGSGLPSGGWNASCPPYGPTGGCEECRETIEGRSFVFVGGEITLNVNPRDLAEIYWSLGQPFFGEPGAALAIIRQDDAAGTVTFRGLHEGLTDVRVNTTRIRVTGNRERRQTCRGERRIRVMTCARTLAPATIPHSLSGGGWSIGSVEVSQDDGLVLRDVSLGTRLLARKISLPYVQIELRTRSGNLTNRCELRPDGDLAIGRSRLVGFQETANDHGIELRADYLIDRLPDESDTAQICISQTYKFMRHDPFNDCNALETTCSRFYPTIEYAFVTGESSNVQLQNIGFPQRFEFEVDGAHNRIGLAKDSPSLATTLAQFPSLLFPSITFIPADQNPAQHEWLNWAVLLGFSAIVDNIHQGTNSFISSPMIIPPIIGGHGGCPECVHIHPRWAMEASPADTIFNALQEYFGPNSPRDFDGNWGQPMIPPGSLQSVVVGHSLHRAEEDDPGEWRDLIWSGPEPYEPYDPETGNKLVFWYEGSSRAETDAFFVHGGFFIPEDELPHESALRGGARIVPAGAPPEPILSPILRLAPTELLPLDDTWTLRFNGRNVPVSRNGNFFIPNIPAQPPPERISALDFRSRLQQQLTNELASSLRSEALHRVTGFSPANGVMRFVTSEFFQSVANAFIRPSGLDITVIPQKSPESLAIDAGPNPGLLPDEARQLLIIGRYADGSTSNLTARTNGTVYRSSNPSVATVDTNGLVTAHRPGICFVSALNEGALSSRVLPVGVDIASITGTVLDTNGAPVSGATVAIFSLGIEVVTDANGRFRIQGVPTTFGALVLTVERFQSGQRFLTVVRNLVLSSNGVTDLANVTLLPLPPAGKPMFYAGGAHTVALRTNGTLWTWGENGSGQLGNGTNRNTNTPQPIETNSTWLAVASGQGGYHTAAIRADSTLWTWGENFRGQLGNGTFTDTNTPQQILPGTTWQAVAAGDAYTVALRTDGALWTWGGNDNGQLGNGTLISANTPQPIEPNSRWKAVAASATHSAALRDDGTLWTWGNNRYGQLGNGTTTDTNTPQQIRPDIIWEAVATGDGFTVALRNDGTLWTWGYNGDGQLGDGTFTSRDTPQPLQFNTTWLAVAAGGDHALAVRSDGTLWVWGENCQGQLGTGESCIRTITPLQVGSDATWVAVAAGYEYTMALRAEGTLWAWGESRDGQLGNGSFVSANTPQPIQTNSTWQAVAAGHVHTAALRDDGSLWTWGANTSGQLGNGTFTPNSSFTGGANVPQPIQTNRTWLAVAAGVYHTVALREDGTLWTWGENLSGQLGNGSFVNVNTPQPIQTNTTWQAVAAGYFHTVAVAADGTLWTWGANDRGQLGNGTLTSTNIPQPIQTNTTWLKVAAGFEHTVAVAADGTLWTWGYNNRGQLGDGTLISRSEPQSIQPATMWQAVAAGRDHTLAVRADGGLMAWGANDVGQVGDGTTSHRNTPQTIQSGTIWQAVSARLDHSAGRRTDGTLWTWGYNGYGQLGRGGSDRVPQPIQTSTTWQAVAAGGLHTLGLRTDGSLSAWGRNSEGQIAQPFPWRPNPVFGGPVWGPPPPP